MVAMGIIYPPNPILIIKAPILPLEGFRCEGFGVKAWGVGFRPHMFSVSFPDEEQSCAGFVEESYDTVSQKLWLKLRVYYIGV